MSEVRHGGDRHENIRRQLRLHRIMHLDGGFDLHRRNLIGKRKLGRSGDQAHVGAEARKRFGNGIALLAG